ncbi:HNH endonuclease signature motif containing protein [Nocardioides pyridinolyticus]
MTAMANPRHRVSVAVAHARAEVGSVRDSSVWSMDREETTATLVELTRLRSEIDELTLRVVEHADDVVIDTWTHATKQTRAAVRGAEKLAFALTERHHVRTALAAGDLLTDQARVIAHALDTLPSDLDPATVVKAEQHLVTAAREHDAKTLRILGRRLLEVVAPEVADAHEAALLVKEERDAVAGTRLTLRDNGKGRYVGTFDIPTFHGAALLKLLLGDTANRQQHGPSRLGRAFCELIEGKVETTLVVTMTYESLIGDLEQAGLLETGDKISPAMARRLACEAKIRPAVLGGRSEVLDLGRSRRLHSQAQRIAIGIRDRHCTEPGCDWPPSMCHVHHDHPWAHGGKTDLDNGRLLCPRHHARLHRRQ